MAETYCGKICAECTYKELLNCPGCKDDSGQQLDEGCDVAVCCIDNGFQNCDACELKERCCSLQNREQMLKSRKGKIEAAQQKKEARALLLSRWLWILFWLRVLAVVPEMVDDDFVMQLFPNIYIIGSIMAVICSIVCSAILIKISSAERRYCTAGICTCVYTAAQVLKIIIFGATEATTTFLLFTIPAAIVGLYGEHAEYAAHSAVLVDVNNKLSGKWSKLWKWFIGSMLCAFGSAILALIFSSMVLTVSLIIFVIVLLLASILKFVYLYQTAQEFEKLRFGTLCDKFEASVCYSR